MLRRMFPVVLFSRDGMLVVPPGATVISLPNPTANGQLVAHTRMTASLFEREPMATDVIQGGIPNCTHLSSVNAVLMRPDGKWAIQQAMKDDGRGNVIIRLFQSDGPKYYSVEKSVYRSSVFQSRGLVGRGALWVSMLEKCFMALMANRSYTGNRGNPGDMLKLLVGPTTPLVLASTNAGETLAKLFNILHFRAPGTRLTPTQVANIDAARTEVTAKIFAGRVDRMAEFERTYQKEGNWWPDKQTERTLTKLHAVIQRLSAPLRELILGYAIGHEAVEGVAAMRGYARKEWETYLVIQRALATDRAVTAGTNFSDEGGGSVGSSGETQKVGLFGAHEYTVVAVEERVLGGRGQLGVILRNPHGETGREYLPNGTFRATKNPQFWMELRDFCANFHYTVGAAVRSDGRRALMEGDLAARLLAAKAGLKHVAPPTPPSPAMYWDMELDEAETRGRRGAVDGSGPPRPRSGTPIPGNFRF